MFLFRKKEVLLLLFGQLCHSPGKSWNLNKFFWWEPCISVFSICMAVPLTLPILYISESCIEIKINLNFYFDTPLWCLERFYEGL